MFSSPRGKMRTPTSPSSIKPKPNTKNSPRRAPQHPTPLSPQTKINSPVFCRGGFLRPYFFPRQTKDLEGAQPFAFSSKGWALMIERRNLPQPHSAPVQRLERCPELFERPPRLPLTPI